MMFILLALIMLIDYTADKEKFLFAYRFSVAGMPINILDLLVGLASIAALFNLKKRYPDEQTHKGFKWTIVMIFLACLTGSIGGFFHSIELREIADMTRNVATLGLCVFIGYFTISTLKQARWASYLILISSAASALFVLLFLRDSIESLKWSSTSFNELRSNDRGGDLGLVTTTFLAFCGVAGYRFFPRFVGLFLLALCTAGSFAMPHRSLWLTAVATLLFATLVLPKVRLGRRITAFISITVVLGVVLVGGVMAYTRLTGRNFEQYIGVRFRSMLPGVEETKDNKAWDTRLPGAILELKIWGENPITGGGFSIQNYKERQQGWVSGGGYRHNVWTSSLAEGGLPMFLGFFLPCVLSMVIGNRLVAARMDQGSVMMGAVAALHGAMAMVLAAATMSINQQRPAIPLGIICGLLLRTRDMQQAVLRSYDGYLDTDSGGFILPADDEYV